MDAKHSDHDVVGHDDAGNNTCDDARSVAVVEVNSPAQYADLFQQLAREAAQSQSPATTGRREGVAVNAARHGDEARLADDEGSSSHSHSHSHRYKVSGICGRFIRGRGEADFEKLSEEPGKVLSWVVDADGLENLLGLTAVDAMMAIGFSSSWLLERLRDGTEHRLVLFPQEQCVQATWEGVQELIHEHYPPAIGDLLDKHMDEIKRTPYDVIDPSSRLRELSELSVDEKHAHEEFLSAERLLQLPLDEVTAYHVRGFLYHSVGCNYLFTGDGHAPKPRNTREFLTWNRRIQDIPLAHVTPLHVTEEEIMYHH